MFELWVAMCLHARSSSIEQFKVSAVSSSVSETPMAPGQSGSKELEALIAAVRAHEAKIPGLAWDQEVSVESVPRAGKNGVLCFKTRFVVAPDGRWSIDSQRSVVEGEKTTWVSETLLFDGKQVLASNKQTRGSGLIRGQDTTELHESLISPLMLLAGSNAQRVSSPIMHRLSDVISALSDVELDDRALPLLRLEGSRPSNGKWERVAVTFDVERDFLPLKISRTLEVLDVVKEELEITAAEEVEGVWIPTAGRRVLFAAEPTDDYIALTQERRDVLDAQCAKLSKDENLDLSKFEGRKRYAEICRTTYGVPLFKQKLLGGGAHILRARNLEFVTTANAASLLAHPFKEGDLVTDVRSRTQFRFKDGDLVAAAPRPAPAP